MKKIICEPLCVNRHKCDKCEVWSHDSHVAEESGLLASDTVSWGARFTTFLWNIANSSFSDKVSHFFFNVHGTMHR